MNDLEETRKSNFDNLTPWVRICKLLLYYGANPNACCVNGYHCWCLEVQRSRISARSYPVFNPENISLYVEASKKKVWDNSNVELDDISFRYCDKSCSVSAVFTEVFAGKTSILPGAQELVSIVENKKPPVKEIKGSSARKLPKKNGKKKRKPRGA